MIDVAFARIALTGRPQDSFPPPNSSRSASYQDPFEDVSSFDVSKRFVLANAVASTGYIRPFL